MKDYIRKIIVNYNNCLINIQNNIEECSKNDLWDIVKTLEKANNDLFNIIKEYRLKLEEIEQNKFTNDDIEAYTLIKTKDKQKCILCGDLTEYIDYCCKSRVCSRKCSDKLYGFIKEEIN